MDPSSPNQSRRGGRPLRSDSDSPDNSDPNAASRKPAWTRRPDASPAAAPVMGASSSWPALSESARSSQRPPSTDPPSDVPSPTDPSPKATGIARQKPGRRAPNGLINNEDRQQQAPAEEARASPRDNKGADHGPRPVQGFGRGEPHHRGYGGNHRRGSNNGGAGSHHSGRRDTDRGNHDWNSHQGFGPVHPQHRQPPRPTFIRAPMPGPPHFMGPPSPMQHFGAPMGYPEMPPMIFVPAPPPPPEAYRAVPYIAPPAVFIPPPPPPPDHQLHIALLKQIEYYFSPENLCKDVYLRGNMNGEGWVSVEVIAGFNRVRQLTSNLQLILETIRNLPELEIQGDKIRRRNDWRNWLIHKPPVTGNQGSQDFGVGSLTASMGNVALGEGAVGQINPRSNHMNSAGNAIEGNECSTSD